MKLLRVLCLGVVLCFAAMPSGAEIQSSPIGAAVECGDGMYSTKSGRGACSHHGGIKRTLTAAESRGDSRNSGRASDTLPAAVSYDDVLINNRRTNIGAPSGLDNSVGAYERTIPDTGGAPLLMFLSGAGLALGGVIIRRRIS